MKFLIKYLIFLYPKDTITIKLASANFNKNKRILFNLINNTIILKLPTKDPSIILNNFILYLKIIDTEYKIKKSQKKFISNKIST